MKIRKPKSTEPKMPKAPKAPKLPKAQKAQKQPKEPKVKKAHKLNLRKLLKSKKALIAAGVACTVAVGGIAFSLFGGKSPNTAYDMALKNVAEARYYMKSAQSQDLDIQFYAGIREEQFARNGVATKSVPFAVVNVLAGNSLKAFDQINGEIRIGAEQYPFTLLQNPYNPLNFTYDIVGMLRNNINANDEVEVTLFISDTNHPTIALENAFTPEAISWDAALRVASEKLAGKIQNQKFESYITIIDNIAKDSGAFWYVQFITTEGQTHYCVVAPDGSAIA